MERHIFSSQAFVPYDCESYLVLVAPHGANDRPDVSGIRAFRVPGNVGINYRADTWHHPLTALDEAPHYLIRDRDRIYDSVVTAPIACHGHPGQAYRTGLALAEWRCRTADRIRREWVDHIIVLGEVHLRHPGRTSPPLRPSLVFGTHHHKGQNSCAAPDPDW